MILYLIRHGQSVANEQGIIQGHMNFPLSADGNEQAQLVGQSFAQKRIDHIYSSDLDRALQTAQCVSEFHPLEVTKWEKLREVGLGPFEGKTRQEISLQYPNCLEFSSILTTGVAGTETVEEITLRCQHVLEQLQMAHRNDRIVIVSHGGFISIFLMYAMLGEQWYQEQRPFVIGNTGVSKIEFASDGKLTFHYINNQAHLHYYARHREETGS